MVVVQQDNGMLGFETLTFAPFDLRLVDTGLLTANEIEWLNRYHEDVRQKLSSQLAGADLAWLQVATQAAV
jgi:Xaa-Pro aminopeptidase